MYFLDSYSASIYLCLSSTLYFIKIMCIVVTVTRILSVLTDLLRDESSTRSVYKQYNTRLHEIYTVKPVLKTV